MKQTQEVAYAVCGNCKYFVVGGKCERVMGEIKVEDICDIHEFGDPSAYGLPVIPSIPKIEVNYRPAYWDQLQDGEYSPMEAREAITQNVIQNEVKRMKDYGISPDEIFRTIQSYIEDPNKPIFEWPPMPEGGMDMMANIPVFKVPSTKFPPIYQPNTKGPTEPYWVPDTNPYPNNPTPDPLGSVKKDVGVSRTYDIYNPMTEPTANWLGLASDKNSEPPTIGVTPYNLTSNPPISIQSQMVDPNVPDVSFLPSFDAPQFHEQEARLAKYIYTSHEKDDVCRGYNGKIFDLNNLTHRPVVPSEGLGYTTTHPNCKCYWNEQKTTVKPIKTADKKQQKDITGIRKHITRKANQGKLHTVKTDGTLSKRTRKSNPMREALIPIREEFGWLTDDYISKARDLAQNSHGKLFLVRAASEAITDHRSEGEPLRRKLAGDELKGLARTAISKGADINHNPNFRTNTSVIDSEYDETLKQLQMLILVSDPEIINGIDNQTITAVSINGGSPRSESVEPCDDHCVTNCELCLVPRGVVLGELDDIALTWVVTNPRGLEWRGMLIPPATPGVKNTAIEPV